MLSNGPPARKILIVEDAPDLLTFFQEALEMEGYEVIVATSGEEALVRAEEQPHLILMDIFLPGEIDGLEATRRLKADPRFRRIPIIGMTAGLVKEEVIRGFDDFLFKPIEVDHLTAVVEQWLGGPSAKEPAPE